MRWPDFSSFEWFGLPSGIERLPALDAASALVVLLAALVVFVRVGSASRQTTDDRLDDIARARDAAKLLAGFGVIVVDAAGRVLEANEIARRVFWPKHPRDRAIALPSPLRRMLDDPGAQQHTLRVGRRRLVDLQIAASEGEGSARGIVVRDVTEDRRGRARLLQLAHFDSLTGLGNRRLFIERLKLTIEASCGAGGSVALLYIDIDRFKEVNDTLGHVAGDELLKAVAQRFRNHSKAWQDRFGEDRSFVARLSGDEFAIFVVGFDDAGHVEGLARNVLAALSEPVPFEGRSIPCSASMGVAILPDHGRDVEDLVKAADAALYVAKQGGRGRFVVFEQAFRAQAEHDRKIERGLREAMAKHELRLHFQPKIQVSTGTVTGFEALLRWYNDELGFVSPKDFIPVAEERGLICGIGAWCLDEACRQIKSWREAGFATVPVSVNVSSAQFVESDLQRIVTEALVRHDVAPAELEIELTESLILDDNETTALALRDLRAIGVRVALDDFGTGYSALTYLNRFPLDTVKMDRGFLRGIEDDEAAAGIARAVIAMSHSLGFQVVAEGVDCERQATLLRQMECDQIQGFLYSPGVPAHEATRFLARRGEEAPRISASELALATTSIEDEAADRDAMQAPIEDENVESDPILAERPRSPETRALVVDDAEGRVGAISVRMMRLGADVHLVQDVDEASLFVNQDDPIVDLLVVPIDADLDRIASLRERIEKGEGTPQVRVLAVGSGTIDEARRQQLRQARVDWLITGAISDGELRFFIGASRHHGDRGRNQRAIRIPLETTTWIRANGDRRIGTLTSLSRRGAFVETDDPYAVGQSIRLEFKVGATHVRVFGNVTYRHIGGQSTAPYRATGIGIVFYEPEADTVEQVDAIIEQTWSRHIP